MRKLKRNLMRVTRKFCISRPKLLWQRYALGFAIVFTTISVSHWASLETIIAAEDDAEVLSVSNRQRMLSQRILFLMSELEEGHDPLIRQRLESALDLFESSHDWLVNRPDLPPQLRELYFEKEPISLDAFSRRFVQMAGIVEGAQGQQAEDLHAVLAKWGTEDLIAALATASNLFLQDSQSRIADLQHIERVSVISALIALFVEALFIFLPAQFSVNTAIRRMDRRKERLSSSLAELRARNAELISVRKSLTRAANHDALTGLLNRRAIHEQMGNGGTSQQGGDFTSCVMKIDLDLFKQVNDTLGHDAGDRVLVHVADILRGATRQEDWVGRIGGDEFVVLLDNPPSFELIEEIGRRIVSGVGKPLLVDGVQARIGASVGFTIAASSNATPDQLLIEADLALYEAKRMGRGRVVAYCDALSDEIESRRTLFSEIVEALSGDQFEAYLQPQVYTETGEIYGCEVLARWQHPERGLIPPATFIAAAEEAGLVDHIDRIIIGKGLDILENLLAGGVNIRSISVNASPSTLRDPHLTDRLLQEVHARHLTPAHLTVEVLESTLIENDDDIALRTIERLSKAGFAVVLDDFGTGYASMSNLSRLKLDGIKLDQSLIRPVPDPRADSIISALVTLSTNLGMNIVAEGVETQAHFKTVRDLGCEVVQGFGIGRPMPEDKFIAWFSSYCAEEAITKMRA